MLEMAVIVEMANNKEIQKRIIKDIIGDLVAGSRIPGTHLKEAYEGRNSAEWGAIYVNISGDFLNFRGRGEYEDVFFETEILIDIKEVIFKDREEMKGE